MKRYIIALALIMTTLLSAQTFADSIGVIDMDRVLQTYREASGKMEELKDKREVFQKDLEVALKKLEDAKSRNDSPDRIEEIQNDIKDQFEPRRVAIMQTEMETRRSIFNKVLETTKVVAKEYGIDTILAKEAVYWGGFDLTEFVVDRLNK